MMNMVIQCIDNSIVINFVLMNEDIFVIVLILILYILNMLN
jgi:hypothetical protein